MSPCTEYAPGVHVCSAPKQTAPTAPGLRWGGAWYGWYFMDPQDDLNAVRRGEREAVRCFCAGTGICPSNSVCRRCGGWGKLTLPAALKAMGDAQ